MFIDDYRRDCNNGTVAGRAQKLALLARMLDNPSLLEEDRKKLYREAGKLKKALSAREHVMGIGYRGGIPKQKRPEVHFRKCIKGILDMVDSEHRRGRADEG